VLGDVIKDVPCRRKSFLDKYEKEAQSMLNYEFDMERELEASFRDGYLEGLEEILEECQKGVWEEGLAKRIAERVQRKLDLLQRECSMVEAMKKIFRQGAKEISKDNDS
jgi:flagellar biosynthesis/type III secretory pathway protein FliH